MKHKIKCPSCRRSLTVPDSYVGKTGKCPACAKPFLVSLPKDVKQENATTHELKQEPNPNLIECPDCYHRVSKAAYSCPSCGRPLRGKAVECYLTVSREFNEFYSMRDIAVWIDQNLVARLENGDTSTVQFDAGLHSVQLGMYGMLGGPPSTDFSEEFQISEGAHLILNFTPAGGFLGTTWISEWSEKID